MADDSFVTKKDFVTLTQKVSVENSKDLAKPIVEQQKKNDLKELERTIEQKALFQDIADGIRGVGDSLIEGLKTLIPKTDGGLSKLLGLGLGLLLAPFAVFIGFLGQLGTELNFFTKGKAAAWLDDLKLRFKGFFTGVFDKLKNSKLGKFIGGIINKLKNSKIFKSISSLFQKVFGGGKKGFFSRLSGIFKSIVKFATGGPFKAIMGFAKNIGRILGKVFLPITVLMGIFDFVKGFMRGYKEGGIVEGIKQGIMDLVDGLIGGLIRILMWIPTKLAEWLGLDNLATAIGEYTDEVFAGISEIFSNLVDFVKAIFTWDTAAMSKTLGGVWDGIKKIVIAPFKVISALVKDIFGGPALLRAELMLKKIGLSIASFFLFLQETFLNMIKKVTDILPEWATPDGLLNLVDNLQEGTRNAKQSVDANKKLIEEKQILLEKEIKMQKLKAEEEKRAKTAPSGAIQGAALPPGHPGIMTTNNSVSYNVYGNTTELSAGALGHMTR
tara:strand:+ start:14023 stop:15516 length:1494 start_codon:yes stop_codon:yes gene_type:complete